MKDSESKKVSPPCDEEIATMIADQKEEEKESKSTEKYARGQNAREEYASGKYARKDERVAKDIV